MGTSRTPSVRLLFSDARAVPAVLGSLGDTRVGRMPGRVFLAGRPDVEEDDLEEMELWAPEEEGARSSGVSEEEEAGFDPPSRMHLSFFLPFVFLLSLYLWG